MNGYWALPAGHVEAKEFATDTALRELKEEVGVTSAKKYLKHVFTESQFGTDQERVNIYFEVTKWIGEPRNAEPHKTAVTAWMDPLKVRGKKFVPNELQVLKAIAKGSTYGEFDYVAYIEKQSDHAKKQNK